MVVGGQLLRQKCYFKSLSNALPPTIDLRPLFGIQGWTHHWVWYVRLIAVGIWVCWLHVCRERSAESGIHVRYVVRIAGGGVESTILLSGTPVCGVGWVVDSVGVSWGRFR